MNDTPQLLEDWQISDLLANLVDKSLVVFEADSDGGGRYRLLETVRQYGEEKLYANGESHDTHARHRDFFLRWGEGAHAKLGGSEQNVWFARMESERDNLRLALETCLADSGGAEAGLRLARAMQHALHVQGRLAESQTGLTAALARPEAAAPTALRGWTLNEAGYVARCRRDTAQARLCFQEALDIFRALDDNEGLAASLTNLGVEAHTAGNRMEARQFQEEAVERSRAAGIGWLQAIALTNLSGAYWEDGDYETTQSLLEQTASIWRAQGDALNEAYVLMKLGNLPTIQQKPEEARAYFVRTLRPLSQSGDRWSLAGTLESLARLDIAAQQNARAAVLLLNAQSLRNRSETPEIFPLRLLETVRETLGPDAFAAAETAARARTLADVIEEMCRNV